MTLEKMKRGQSASAPHMSMKAAVVSPTHSMEDVPVELLVSIPPRVSKSVNDMHLHQFVRSMQQLFEEVNKNTHCDTPAELPDINKLIEVEAAFFFSNYVKEVKSMRQLAKMERSVKGSLHSSSGQDLQTSRHVTMASGTVDTIPEATQGEKTETDSVRSRSFMRWIREVVYQDIYPSWCVSPQDIFQVYLKRRQPPIYKASLFGLFNMAVCNVISGEFSGWNPSIAEVGYGNFLLGNLLAAVLYFTLADCLSELSAGLPVLGGAFAYSRALLGNSVGFVVGNSENLMYCMFLTLLNITFSDAIKIMYPETVHLAPIIWLLFSAPLTYLVCCRNRLCWRLMAFGGTVCFAIIAAFVIYGMTIFDVKYLDVGWENVRGASHQSNRNGKLDTMFLTGIIGPFISLPSTAWWYLGIESASLFSKEALEAKHVKASLYGSWLGLSLCMASCSIFGILVPPGAPIISKALFPMAEVLHQTLDPQSSGVHFIWIVFPSLAVNFIGSLMAASRQTFALSRSGYLPSWLSITTTVDKIPQRAAIFASCYSFVTCFSIEYLQSLESGLPILQALVSIVVISGSVVYIGVGISYLAFYYKYPKAPRPFRNFLGRMGACVLISLSLSILVVQTGVNVVFQFTCIAYLSKMLISGVYFVFYGRFHLKPTEESLVTSFWKS
jgi:ethanolamine permease